MVAFHASYLYRTKLPRAWAWLLISLFLSTTFHKALGQQEKTVAQQQIEHDRLAIEQARRLNLSDREVGRLWAQIGSDEETLGQMDRAEAAYVHALALFEHDPSLQIDYAITLNNLGGLYAMTNREQESLKCRKRSLGIFRKLGDPLHVARAEAQLADAYLILEKYKEAEQHSMLANRSFSELTNATAEDRASALLGYAFSSCMADHCREGLIAAQQAIALTRANFREDSFPFGQAHVVLGYTEWKTGDSAQAERDLQNGINILRHALFPAHPLVVHALDLYRLYLLDAHRETEAKQIAEEEMSPAGDASCAGCKVSVYGLRGK